MYKKIVYIEKSVAEHKVTKQILEKLQNPGCIYIDNYKDILNQNAASWRLQKQVQKIILAERKDNFYYKGSEVTPAFGYENFYYNTLAINCVYDCDYCYLQGMFTTPHLVLFVNNNDYLQATSALIKKLQQPLYMALSYDTDLLAIENIYPYCAEWVNYVAAEKNITIEIRTKSVNVNALMKLIPNERVILAWTLSPQEVINFHEPLTPPENSRIKAIAKALQHGWRVRICIDPILHIPNWKAAYDALIKNLNEHVSMQQIDSFSLGVFRMNTDFLKRIKQQRNDTAVLLSNFEKQEDIATYNAKIKEDMLTFIQQQILAYAPQANIELI